MYRNKLNLQSWTLNNVYGSHMVMRMQMEQNLLSQFQRLPGLRSEYAGLETLMGRDEDFGPEDYLNCTARFNVLLIH